ncbi:hypothetical protein PHLGIDRAFT_33436 [Phlebiopsis gigantea 11061_1 CR5-6]|uniref:F-box domain-containing protein n=1 Tax=Phlebiopsis gigantea (strain 11061_1 CR5-6) TaxID=745531 RepID=A0A0C3SCV9_PHLG1|nr:hypothetical protein PHLGIDRAFT_33436 [Phlebiopsis gigantea 11061_1 CR5-6]
MTFLDIPTELIEWILDSCGFLDLLRCQVVCRFLRETVQNSPRLAYKIELGISGYTDEHVNPACTLDARQRMLKGARRLWNRPCKFELVESLDLTLLSYWPVREGILLCAVESENGGHLFDVRVLTHTPGPPTESWQVNLPVAESGILFIDPCQELVVTRAALGEAEGKNSRAWFSCSLVSLRTGQKHPLAKEGILHLKVSERVQSKPHYTRVQTFGSTLCVSMASGIQLFTEMTTFNWHTGEQLATFSSPIGEHRSWGDTGILISPTSLLLTSYSKSERTCHIDVYTFDTLDDTAEGCNTGGFAHVATYALPHMRLADFRALLTPSPVQRIHSAIAHEGYLASSADSLMMRVYLCSTRAWEPRIDDAHFFTPLAPFLRAAAAYRALPSRERRTFVRTIVPWSAWEHRTRWLTKDGAPWMQEVRRGQRGMGTRYAFARHLVDFSPLELAKAASARQLADPAVAKFDHQEDSYETRFASHWGQAYQRRGWHQR